MNLKFLKEKKILDKEKESKHKRTKYSKLLFSILYIEHVLFFHFIFENRNNYNDKYFYIFIIHDHIDDKYKQSQIKRKKVNKYKTTKIHKLLFSVLYIEQASFPFYLLNLTVGMLKLFIF